MCEVTFRERERDRGSWVMMEQRQGGKKSEQSVEWTLFFSSPVPSGFETFAIFGSFGYRPEESVE